MHRPGHRGYRPAVCSAIALAVFAAQLGIVGAAAGQTAPVADAVPRAAPAKSLDDIALELTNPLGNLFSIATDFEYLNNQGYINGASDHPRSDLFFKPSFPFRLKNGKNIVIRGTVPVSFGEPSYPFQYKDFADWRIRQFADLLPNDATVRTDHGFMDDISVDVAYGGVNENGYITMFGAAAVLPVSQDGTGERNQYLLGPEVAFGKVTSWGMVGARATHVVNVAAAGEKIPPFDTTMTSLNVFFSYRLGNGWQIISNPVIEYDWEALDDNRLMFPIGAGFAKTTSIRNMPLRISLEIYNYIESPAAFGPDWLVRFGVTPVMKRGRG